MQRYRLNSFAPTYRVGLTLYGLKNGRYPGVGHPLERYAANSRVAGVLNLMARKQRALGA